MTTLTVHRCAVLGTVLVVLIGVALAGIPLTKRYERQFKASWAAYDVLSDCLANVTKQNHNLLEEMLCYENATASFRYNATWWKQLAAHYHHNGFLYNASTAYNASATTHLESNGFTAENKEAQLPLLSQLELLGARDRPAHHEVSKVSAQYLSMVHETALAHEIHEQMLNAQLDEDDMFMLQDFYRSIGDATRAAWQTDNDTSISLRVAQEICTTMEHLQSKLLFAQLLGDRVTPAMKEGTLALMKAQCGATLPYSASYTYGELMKYIVKCTVKHGSIKPAIEKERALGDKDKAQKRLRRNTLVALHTLASMGMAALIDDILAVYPEYSQERDPFGRTILYRAIAGGHFDLTKHLVVDYGLSLTDKDAGGVRAGDLACLDARFRLKFIKWRGEGSCSEFSMPGMNFEDPDDRDDLNNEDGGKWNAAPSYRSDTPECEFDVRDAAGMTHNDVIGQYVAGMRPVVLRNAYSDMKVSPRTPWRRENVLKLMNRTLLRKEPFPFSEKYGKRNFGVTTVLELIGEDITQFPSNVFGVTEVPPEHALYKMADIVPRVLDHKTTFVDLDFNPVIIFRGSATTTNSVFRQHNLMHMLMHGKEEWVIIPPPTARATSTASNNLFDSVPPSAAMKCTLYGGDVLLLPRMWSAASRAKGKAGVAIQRDFQYV